LPVDLQRAMAESGSLKSHFLRYLHCFTLQIEQTALANSEGKIEERLARWLLMAHDRIEGDDVAFTHELIAFMLGTRRAGVTIALSDLGAKGLMATNRKLITILDRAGLKGVAGGLYGAPEAEYKRVFGRGTRRAIRMSWSGSWGVQNNLRLPGSCTP
jgi:hypothetical protein